MTRDELEAVIRRQMTRAARSMLQAVDSNRVMNDALDTILDATRQHIETETSRVLTERILRGDADIIRRQAAAAYRDTGPVTAARRAELEHA